MVIEKVFGLQSTGVSLSDRFALLTNAAPGRVARQQRKRRASMGSLNQNYNYSNRANRLLDQVARRLEQQVTKRQPLKQRLGFQQGNLRRFDSESSLPGLKRSNSFGNLSQQSVKNRVNWRQSNGNLSRAASLNNITNQVWRYRGARGFRKRGGDQRGLRGRFRGRGRGQGWRLQQYKNFQQRPGVQQRWGLQQRLGFTQRGGTQRRGTQRRGAKQNGLQQTNEQKQQNDVAEQSTSEQTEPQFHRPQTARRGVPRGRGRGAITRSQTKLMPMLMSKEQLDAQLDQYMSCTKAALDKELDEYMRNAMELE